MATTTTTVATNVKAAKGGSFLIESLAPDAIFTPEDFTQEQISTAKTAVEFATNEVLPAAAEIEFEPPRLKGNLHEPADLT